MTWGPGVHELRLILLLNRVLTKVDLPSPLSPKKPQGSKQAQGKTGGKEKKEVTATRTHTEQVQNSV